MKRFFTFVLAFGLMLCTFTVARAEYTYIRWPQSNATVGIPDAVLGFEGDGETRVVFFVRSYGNGWAELYQTQGTCSELSYVKMFSGFFGDAKEWGKYEIRVVHAESGMVRVYQWDDTYSNDHIRLEFPASGNYYVDVRPYTDEEMTASYMLDIFGDWNEPPRWWIERNNNCSFGIHSPYE